MSIAHSISTHLGTINIVTSVVVFLDLEDLDMLFRRP